jgi:hypothetical protein
MAPDRYGRRVGPRQRRPVDWYALPVLRQAVRDLVMSADLLRHLDRRETFSTTMPVVDLAAEAQADGFWFDFIADTGDGGDATYTVAQGALRRELHLADEQGRPHHLPEGRLLVLGGDLAYPGGSGPWYQYRFIEPFEYARDPASRFERVRNDQAGQPVAANQKVVLAIPQNHDWFDSASTFCRYFVGFDRGAVLGARTPQQQTYFAARLPGRWWLLGLDFALSGDIDRQQYEAFRRLVDEPGGITPGDRLILLVPEPYWTRRLGDNAPAGYPRRYQRLEAALSAVAPIRLRLAGDLHHYLHEWTEGPEPLHLLIAGCGGAFLHPTHTHEAQAEKRLDAEPEDDAGGPDVDNELRHRVRVGIPEPGQAAAGRRFQHRRAWPDPERSWRLAAQNLVTPQPHVMIGFALLIGLVLWCNGLADQGLAAWVGQALATPWQALPNGLLLAGGWWFIQGEPKSAVSLAGVAALGAALWGLAYGLAVMLAGVGWPDLSLPVQAAWLGLTLVLAMLASGLLLGLTLWTLVALGGRLANNAFSTLAIEDHKGFLRLHITPAGRLVVHLVGIDQVPRRDHFDGVLPPGWRLVDRFEID